MLIQTVANIYRLNVEEKPTLDQMLQAVKGLPDDNWIVEIIEKEKTAFCTKTLLDKNKVSAEIRIPLCENCFEKARRVVSETGFALITAEDGNYVACLMDIPTYYVHPYSGDGGFDLDFLNGYDCLVLSDCNEYSIILLKALDAWQGKKIILCGSNWKPFLGTVYLPAKEIVFSEECNDGFKSHPDIEKTLFVELFLQKKDSLDRYKKDHILCYDEVMTITCLFFCRKHPGIKNRGKKFFVINGAWTIEGIFGIWDKAFTVARYVQRKGFIPVFHITWSDDSIYSDEKGEDIWGKFFYQPGNYSIEEVLESDTVTFSPNMNILNVMQYIMNSISEGEELIWENGIFNQRIREYISERRKKFLPDPENTLGVLVRGTDYTKTHMAGHAVHADADMVINKIREAEKEWKGYKYIYLSTEDIEIYERLKQEFGEKLIATDQERFRINSGELLYELHVSNKRKGKGFRLGAEYLCTIRFLSECESLIASGGCGGVDEALRENRNCFKHVFIFNLGINPV